MIATLLATVGHGGTAFWYLTRATGLVAMILLSATVVLGIVASVGWTTERWPRFLSQALHRNLSLFCLVLVVVHVVTTVADGFVPISLVQMVVPFGTAYRPLWVGLGALAFDLMLAVALTSAFRRRLGLRAWRGVHWLAYVCWPIALLHGLGTGSDSRIGGAQFVYVLCVLAVVAAGAWRLAVATWVPAGRRLALGSAGIVVMVGTAVFALQGPLRPGWSQRAGTSSSLLAHLTPQAIAGVAAGTGGSGSTGGTGGSGSTGGTGGSGSTGGTGGSGSTGGTGGSGSAAGMPAVPFDQSLSGTFTTTPSGNGTVEVQLSMHLEGSGTPLTVTLYGQSVEGGVSMTSSQVNFGPQQGVVTGLEGTTIAASVSGPGNRGESLVLQLQLDRANGTVSGTVRGRSGGGGQGAGDGAGEGGQ